MKWRHRKGRGEPNTEPQGKDEADESAPPREDVLGDYETAARSMDFADEVEQRRRDAKDRLASSGRPVADQPDDHGQGSEGH
jgi:hypothetical protein